MQIFSGIFYAILFQKAVHFETWITDISFHLQKILNSVRPGNAFQHVETFFSESRISQTELPDGVKTVGHC